MYRSTVRASLHAVLLWVAATFALTAQAQSLPPGVHLGMSAEALQSALPGVERMPKPQRLAGGLVGNWRAAPIAIAGVPFEPVFFFASGQLRRVEWMAATEALPDRGAAAFDEIVSWGRAAFGPEVGSRDPGSAYAAWTQGDTDVYAQHVSDPRRASVRLVYKARQVKDASEL